MKIWKIVVFLALPYLILGCCKCADYIVVTKYSLCSITTDILDTSIIRQYPISTADSIAAENFGLLVSFETSKGLCKAPVSIFKQATACKCSDPQRTILNEAVLSLNITTNNDFDVTHKAGDNVNSYFNKILSDSYQILDEFIQQNLAIEDEPLESFYSSFDLQLMNKPSASGKHSFNIEILLSDNRLLSTTTKEVYLN